MEEKEEEKEEKENCKSYIISPKGAFPLIRGGGGRVGVVGGRCYGN